MKVYILAREPFPNGMAATKRITYYAKGLIEANIKCEVYIYQRTEISSKAPKNIDGHGIFDKIPFRYSGNCSMRSHFLLKRKIDDILDLLRTVCFFYKHLERGDVVLGYTINIFITLLICKISHLRNAKYIRELNELPFVMMVDKKESEKKRKYTFEKILPKLDGVIAISDSLLYIANKHKGVHSKNIKIPIITDSINQNTDNKPPIFPYIFHAGTLNEEKDGFLGMIEAFGISCQKLHNNVHFISTGNKDQCPNLKRLNYLLGKYNIESRVIFLGYISNELLNNYLNNSHLFIINKLDTLQNRFCFPTKLGDYLKTGKIVITTNIGEASYYLKDGINSIIIEANNTKLLAQKIIWVFENKEKANILGQEGKKLLEKDFNYKYNGKILADHFNSL